MKTTFSIYMKDSIGFWGPRSLAGMLLFALLLPVNSWAQQERGRGAQSAEAHHAPYNLDTVETLHGTIIRVDQMPGRRQGMVGIHGELATDTDTVTVHFGPYSFLHEQSFEIRVGDEIEVTGSKIMHENRPALLAANVKRGEEELGLRDQNGKPLWRSSGQGRNR